MKNAADIARMMQNLRIVLVQTNFPENIGMAARASSNFGHSPLFLAEPRRWNYDKALPLATSQGQPLLDSITVTDSVKDAVAPCTFVVGTTARTLRFRELRFCSHVTLLGQTLLGSSSVQFSHSVVSNSLRPMDCSMPGLPVHHQLPELTQTHVH